MRRGLARLAVGAVVALLALAGVALAAVGVLTPEGCINDNDSSTETCLASVDGLGGATSVAVSPDGKSVYVAAFGDDAIVQFERTGNGTLAPLGCIQDNDTGTDACPDTADGLDFATSVAVSPDGTSVYVASGVDDAIARFERDTTTGVLTPKGCIQDNDSGTDGCAKSADGLDGAGSVAISPDGTSVYVTSGLDYAIARFERDTITGKLTAKGCVEDNDVGPDACTQSAAGLGAVGSVAVSADGTSVYAAAGDHTIVHFRRDTITGKLKPRGCIRDNSSTETCDDVTDGLRGARSVAISADGTSVYVASGFDDAIAVFKRNTTSGRLTPKGCVNDNDESLATCGQSADGLDFPAAVTVSPDGASVYAIGEADDAIVRFRRSANGVLTPVGCIDDNDPPQGPDECAPSIDGLFSARSVAVSPDGTSVYVVSSPSVEAAIVRFTRDATP